MNPIKPKRSSSRRKGDIYQDLMALKLALELYIEKKDFELYMEYDNVGNLDDVVIFTDNKIQAYQIKYSVNPNASYKFLDFIDENDPNKKRVNINKFSDGWKKLKESHPNKEINIFLISNHSIDDEINKIIDNQGHFKKKFVKNRIYKKPRENRKKLKEQSKLEEEEFKDFLRSFQLKIRDQNLQKLIQYIQIYLLDNKLGFKDISIYDLLREKFEDFAINRHAPITYEFFYELFEEKSNRYILPQIFKIEEDLYVEREDFNQKLSKAIQKIDGNYIIITGLPGSGKSTTLTKFLDHLATLPEFEVIKYYCFIDIYDNYQNLRLQAESFRINLLNSLQNLFYNILDRRYDYTEQNFNYVLSKVGRYFTQNKRKLIILLDGLDHAEKMALEIHESLLNALPKIIPKGIIIIVGTQELHKWPHFLKICRKNPDQRIELPLFYPSQTEEYLVEKLGLTSLDQETIHEIHRICEGLPIYLKYISELIKSSDSIENIINNLTPIANGNIKEYYNYIWDEFEQFGRGKVRYLCDILACLRFPVKEEDLIKFQKELDYPTFHDSLNLIKHLLRKNNEHITIFHNSFREYIFSQLDESQIKKINEDISDHLKTLESSDEWFSYMFEYSYKIGDYDYILNKVNNDFVESALSYYRSQEDIENAIFWAIEAAKEKKDLISLSRIATLKYITKQRIEHHLNWNLLSEVLLTLGDVDKVIKYTYSLYQNKWLININTTLNVIIQLAKQSFKDLSKELFDIFIQTISIEKFEEVNNLLKFSMCLGIFSKSIKDEIDYLKHFRIQPGYIESQLSEDTGNNFPHLDYYIRSLIKFQDKSYWSSLKEVENVFSKERIQFFIIRALAKSNKKDLLKEEIENYLLKYGQKINFELAYYTTLAKFPKDTLIKLFGDIEINDLSKSDKVKYTDKGLNLYRMKFWTLGYINQKVKIEELKSYLSSSRSWWNDYLLYLILTGQCFGYYLREEDYNWYDLAINSIDMLLNIKPAKKERIWNILRVCHEELRKSLYLLTKMITEKYDLKLNEWFEKLQLLQSSELWTKNISFGESSDNFIFELLIYEKLSKIISTRKYVIQLLNKCETKIKESTRIKGSSRVQHFFLMALVAARCGFKDKSNEFLTEGIKSTLIYGYRKDMTLYQLIYIMGILNKYDHIGSLNRCADILELVDWMPHLTDGAETKFFPYYIFKEVAQINKMGALRLLTIYTHNKARWQMQDCLITLIKEIDQGDPEILWSLTNLITNQYSEEGEYSKKIFKSKQKIVELVDKTGDVELFTELKNRLSNFVKTQINPKDWSKLSFKYKIIESMLNKEENTKELKDYDKIVKEIKYSFKDSKINKNQINQKLQTSFKDFFSTIEILKVENENFNISYEYIEILEKHIDNANILNNLLIIKKFIEDEQLDYSSLFATLGKKLYELGDFDNALNCFEKAYLNYLEFLNWNKIDDYLKIIKEHDIERSKFLVLKKVYNLAKNYSGFQVPSLITNALDIFQDYYSILKLYNNYFTYTKSLFRHLPKKNDYEWLRNYTSAFENFDKLSIDFLVDELNTIEIDLGRILIDTCRTLCIKRPDITLSIFFNHLQKSKGMVKDRLIQILYMVSRENPSIFYPHIEKLFEELNSQHFLRKMMILKTLENINVDKEINEKIREKIESIKYNNSTEKNTDSLQFPQINPSNKFKEFIEANLSLSSKRKIEGCCNVLSIKSNHFIANIEKFLLHENWNEEQEIKRLKIDWNGNVHPQGHPYIPIITHFEYRIINIVNRIIDDILSKNKLERNQIESIWRIFQPVDPEYKFLASNPRPKDIQLTVINNKDIWFKELENLNGTILMSAKLDEWIPLFEMKYSEQEKNYGERYVLRSMQESFLVKTGFSEIYGKNIIIMDLLDKNENMTIEQARKFINNDERVIEEYYITIPILTKKHNYFPFFGYRILVSLPKYIIDNYNLYFKDFNLYLEDKCVLTFEEWQEGYVSDSYSRNLSSYGTRLLINRNLLDKIFQDYKVDLYKEFYEERLYFKNKFSREPTEERSAIYFEKLV